MTYYGEIMELLEADGSADSNTVQIITKDVDLARAEVERLKLVAARLVQGLTMIRDGGGYSYPRPVSTLQRWAQEALEEVGLR